MLEVFYTGVHMVSLEKDKSVLKSSLCAKGLYSMEHRIHKTKGLVIINKNGTGYGFFLSEMPVAKWNAVKYNVRYKKTNVRSQWNCF